VVRSAPENAARVRVIVDGVPTGEAAFQASDGWVERVIAIPGNKVAEVIEVVLANDGPEDFIDYHSWVTQ
jgi:hypothetical protein